DCRDVPKRADLRSVLIVGSGPIRIGQACEFDYSGAQACRVLRREGYRVVLVNSNPATIMTDPEWADATYLEPLDVETVAEIVRPAFTLGGSGGGLASTREELERTVAHGLETSPAGQVLVERSLAGWYEHELEVMSDAKGNCVVVCSIENIDPMGIHTGDSW